MKLLSKINRKYASFSLLIFLVGLILIFLFIKYFIASETDEKLEATKWNVIKNLNQGYEVEFSPFIEVKEFAEKNYKLTEEIKDTLIYNKAEKDYDSYRQLKAVYADSNKNYSII
ncbi:MAG: hypothetical protein WC557_00210, partial [Ignavibacteriaceae bacterium]